MKPRQETRMAFASCGLSGSRDSSSGSPTRISCHTFAAE
jgi:hypothetical protein